MTARRWALRQARTWLRRHRRRRIATALTPSDRHFGFARGTPVDRHYIDEFLRRHGLFPGYSAGRIVGDVLEIGGREYTDRFGAWAEDRVRSVTVFHEGVANSAATIVGDLSDPDCLPAARFDCIICTQVLPVIWDVPAALGSLSRALRPGGTVLITVPGITRTLTPDQDAWGDFWRFTEGSVRRLLTEAFPGDDLRVECFGNVGTATAFLHGLAAEELEPEDLALHDPGYAILIAACVTRAGA